MTYLVSVPEAHYASVIGHLHSLMAGAQTEASAEAQDEGRNWSETTWGMVWPNLTEEQQEWMRLQASNEDQWVGIADIEPIFGTFNLLQGAQRSFSRRAFNHGQQSHWPLEVAHDPATARKRYRMNAAQARIVNRLP